MAQHEQELGTLFDRLATLQKQKVAAMKQLHADLLQQVEAGFDGLLALEQGYQQQLAEARTAIQHKLDALRETISYTEEMSAAQHNMLADAMAYTEKLEQQMAALKAAEGSNMSK